jgi:hypothetical protein
MPETNGKFYKWAFITLLAIIGAVFTYLYNGYGRTEDRVMAYQNQMEEVKSCVNDLKTDIGAIRADLVWIKQALTKTK